MPPGQQNAELGHARRRRILAYLEECAGRGYAPSIREIAAEVGLRSPSSVHAHLWALRADGIVSWQPGLNRTLTIGGRQ